MDKKNVFIIGLVTLLVLSIVFRPSKDIESYEDEIKVLRESNSKLLKGKDSLLLVNERLSDEYKMLLINIDSTQAALVVTEEKLKNLRDGKIKVSGYVNGLDADGVANALTNYLDTK